MIISHRILLVRNISKKVVEENKTPIFVSNNFFPTIIHRMWKK